MISSLLDPLCNSTFTEFPVGMNKKVHTFNPVSFTDLNITIL